MRQFTDSKNIKWSLEININTVKRCIHLMSINLLEPEKGDPPLLTLLGTDEILLCDLIYCLCEEQANKLEITDEMFGAALDGQSILNATNAFYEEYMDFFHTRGQEHRVKMVQKQLETIKKAMERAGIEVQRINVDEKIDTAFGTGSGDSPE